MPGRSPQLIESLGVSQQTLRNWRRQDQLDRHEGDDGITTDAELARLRLRRHPVHAQARETLCFVAN